MLGGESGERAERPADAGVAGRHHRAVEERHDRVEDDELGLRLRQGEVEAEEVGGEAGEPAVFGARPEEDAIEVGADPLVKGRYTGRFTPAGAGEYTIRYSPPGQAEPAEARMRVVSSAEELRQPNVNRLALAQIAGSSGGALVELPDLASVEEKLTGVSKYTELHREASVWDNWLTLALLIGLYANWIGAQLAGFWSAKAMFVVTGAGMPDGAAGWMEAVVGVLLNLSTLVIAACAGLSSPSNIVPATTSPAVAAPVRLKKSARVAPAASAVSWMAPSRSRAARFSSVMEELP